MKLRVKVSDLPDLLNGDKKLRCGRIVSVRVETSESLIVEDDEKPEAAAWDFMAEIDRLIKKKST